jgi:hypothetical protein
MENMKVRIMTDEEIASPSVREREVQAQKELEASMKGDDSGATPPEPAPKTIEEGDVLSFIRERYKKSVNSIDELLEQKTSQDPIPDDIMAIMKYRKETGRNLEDYIRLNKDYDAVDPDDLLLEYTVATEEFLDKDDAKDILAEKFSYDEDDDESLIKKKKSAKKRELAKAKKYFNDLKEKYKAPLESRAKPFDETDEYTQYKEYLDKAESDQKQAQRRSEWFLKKTEEVFNPEFKGFEFNLGEQKLTYSPAEAAEIKEHNSTPMNLIKKFLDADGLISDAAGYHRALAIASNPEKFAKFFYEQGVASATDEFAKKSKNINMDVRTYGQPTTTGGMKVAAVTPPSSGNGLRIKGFKK